MDGTIPLDEVYGRRLELVRPSRADLERVAARYVAEATEDAAAVVSALAPARQGRSHRERRPPDGAGSAGGEARNSARSASLRRRAVRRLPVRYAGFDSASPLARRGGKAEVARRLVAAGGRPAVMIGDGITDLEAASEVDLFVGYGGVEDREAVRKASPVFIRCESLAPILAICLTDAEKKTLSASPDGAALLRKAEARSPPRIGCWTAGLSRPEPPLVRWLASELRRPRTLPDGPAGQCR